jgi:hypothetical protein
MRRMRLYKIYHIPNDFKARKINIPPSYRVCRSTRRFFYENEIRHLYAYSILFSLHKNNCTCTLRYVCTLKRQLTPLFQLKSSVHLTYFTSRYIVFGSTEEIN